MLRNLMMHTAVLGAIGATCFWAPDKGTGSAVADPPEAKAKKWYVLKKNFMGHAAGEKLEMTEEDAVDLIATKTLELVDEDPASDIAEQIVGTLSKKIGDIVNAATEAAIKNLKKAKGSGLSIETQDRSNEENDFGYERFGDLLREIKWHSNKDNPVTTERLKKVLKWQSFGTKTATTDDPISTQSGEDAGVLITPTFSNTLYRKVFEESDILSEVDTYNIGGNQIVFPRLREDSRATGSRYGGVQTFWVAEGNNVLGTKPKFDRLTLALKKLMSLVFVTQETLDDSGMALEQLLMNVIGSEISFTICDAIFNGDGVGKPLGILVAPAKYTQAALGGQGANTFVADNVSQMYARMQARIRTGANWYINQEVEPQLDKLSLAIGTGGSTAPMYLQPGGLTGEAPARLKGRPVKTVEFCPALGTEGDITFWAPSSYCFVTKGGLKTAMSVHLRFDFDEQVFKFTYRCDGAPWWPKPLTPYKGTAKLSTIVTLNSTRT